ncbi:hypothetical protein [Flavobacterium sp. BFFFF1]|uniref:hypothetical protein n=1 Tax=Flavobacterium sp. BFFFF1 TaxID=2015557 RepID=UPI0025C6EA63|nr:hypothetical protein [Flavobacterium sp. BFFFF1]
MRRILLLLLILLGAAGCSDDGDNQYTLTGRLAREVNNEGVANQTVYIQAYEVRDAGNPWAFAERIDSTTVVSDADGNFRVQIKHPSNGYLRVYTPGDDHYDSAQYSFDPDEPIVLKVQKYLKFKIAVQTTSPYDENDYVHIDFFAGNVQGFMTEIENFGLPNVSYPAEQLPGGGGTGAWEDTSWKGTNVNSVVYYNVPENAETHKIFSTKIKNGIQVSGVTQEIPFQEDAVNEYVLEY